MIIPVIFLLNVAMLVTRLTKTMNVDIYNYWHYAITGTVVQLMTGSLIYGVLGGNLPCGAIVKKWPTGRQNGYRTSSGWKVFRYRKATVPVQYRFSFYLMLSMKKIPFMKGRNIDAQEIQKRYGMVGDPVIIGVVLGLIFWPGGW